MAKFAHTANKASVKWYRGGGRKIHAQDPTSENRSLCGVRIRYGVPNEANEVRLNACASCRVRLT